jgi:hypothetical protein
MRKLTTILLIAMASPMACLLVSPASAQQSVAPNDQLLTPRVERIATKASRLYLGMPEDELARTMGAPTAVVASENSGVQLRVLRFAEGTDAGGSIRVPSAWCGTYGFKASFGRVPFVVSANAFGAADSPFLFEGPITRTVEDAAIALNVLAGDDPRDPFSIIEPATDFTAATRRSIRGLKIAYSPNLDVFPVDRGVAEAVGRAVRVFEEAGAHVEEVKLGI